MVMVYDKEKVQIKTSNEKRSWVEEPATSLQACLPEQLQAKVAQSCPTLCDHGVLQARILEWVPFQGDLPNPGMEPRSPTLQADSLPAEPPGKPKNTGVGSLSLLQGISPTQGLLPCRRILYQLRDTQLPATACDNSTRGKCCHPGKLVCAVVSRDLPGSAMESRQHVHRQETAKVARSHHQPGERPRIGDSSQTQRPALPTPDLLHPACRP